MELNEISDQIMAHVYAANYQPVKPRTILKQLSLTDDDEPLLKRALKKLIKKGRIAYGDKHMIFPVVESQAVKTTIPGEKVRPSRKANVIGSFSRTSNSSRIRVSTAAGSLRVTTTERRLRVMGRNPFRLALSP